MKKLILLLGVIVVLVALFVGLVSNSVHATLAASHPSPAAVSSSNWPLAGFNAAGTRYNSSEKTINASNVSGLVNKWTYNTQNAIGSPVIVNGIVYFGSTDTLYAVNATTGALLWQYKSNGGIVGAPAVVSGIVYAVFDNPFAGYQDNLYALNARTGKVLWSFAVNGSPPVVANGVVYIGSDDDNLYALNAKTGALLWKYTTGGRIAGISPAIANGVVYIGSEDQNFYALNATTGALLWSFATGDSVRSSAAVANGNVYIVSNWNVYALNAHSGALKWIYNIGGWDQYGYSSPAVANGVVYVWNFFGYAGGNMFALDAYSGTPLWDSSNSGTPVLFYPTSWLAGTPTVANGVVYFEANGMLCALNAAVRGKITKVTLLASYAVGDWGISSAAIVNGSIYIGSDGGLLYNFR